MKVFVDTDSDLRLARRLKRDISERGRDLTGVLKQYDTYVKPVCFQFDLRVYSFTLIEKILTTLIFLLIGGETADILGIMEQLLKKI